MRDVDDEGSTPLLLGVGSGKKDVVEFLLSCGAEVNTANKVRRTNQPPCHIFPLPTFWH